MARLARRSLFPVNVWPPMVDAVTLVLAALVLFIVVALVAQRGLIHRLGERELELERLKLDKARIERRLAALAQSGLVEVVDGKVILQGEVLFASGSAELTEAGRTFVARLAPPLISLMAAEPDQMILVGGHTDDRPIRTARFASNWELSTARAVAMAQALEAEGLAPGRLVAAGFGEHHPRAANLDDASRQRNRRIEVLLVPMRSVASGAALVDGTRRPAGAVP
jgi:flagellar motor protein MotB